MKTLKHTPAVSLININSKDERTSPKQSFLEAPDTKAEQTKAS